jgi:hypothetical protein
MRRPSTYPSKRASIRPRRSPRRLEEGGLDARVLAPRSSPDGVALVLAEERTVLAVSARGRAVVIGSMDGAGALSPSP